MINPNTLLVPLIADLSASGAVILSAIIRMEEYSITLVDNFKIF